MPAAIFKAEIDFSGGASFDPALVLDDPATPLDVAVLGTAAADTVDITPYVTQCYIRRAFNRSSDAFTGGTARIVFVDDACIPHLSHVILWRYTALVLRIHSRGLFTVKLNILSL